ncbi:pyridoxal 5'-phosphate synthase glutaminase subunit PdxT [Solibacillus sp. CAU 1738]|uniref:pyridoxal 5'-phosphate synthase glutaminase subunit PdxT n=1 Tax=Solibacillus sp. CAU 1738 TaxID=3140363 RepID=UPI00326193A4
MKIGILALQGAVREHAQMLEALNCEVVLVKEVQHLPQLDGLILPGGESTAMRKLLERGQLLEPIRDAISNGLPVFGTCAGLILLAREVIGQESHFAVMDIVVERNSYGRQIDSFEVELPVKHIDDDVKAVFIRAPHIVEVGKDVEVLATFEGKIVLARQQHMLGCAFHPELTTDLRLLRYFVEKVVAM